MPGDWRCNVDGCTVEHETAWRIAEHRQNVHGWDYPDPTRCVSCIAELTTENAEAGWQDSEGLRWCDHCYEQLERREKTQRYAQFARRFPRYEGWSLDTYPIDDSSREAVETAKRWAHVDGLNDPESDEWEDLGIILYICGPVGAGKTGLAWSLARRYIEHPYEWDIAIAHLDRIEFVNVRDLLASARAYYSNGGADPLDGLDTVDLLVLDDLGAERPTDWARDTIATLVERRYLAELPTIVTSNYSPSQLIRRLGKDDPIVGQRIVSRLTESCTVLHIDAPDRRLQAA